VGSSPIDFDEGQANSFEEVTHFDANYYVSAPVEPTQDAENAETVSPEIMMNRYAEEPDAPSLDSTASAASISVENFQIEPKINNTVMPTVHIPTGAYSTRGAKKYKILDPMAEESDPALILVLTKVDHKTLTMRKAMRTPNAEDWRRADVAEFLRFLSIDGIDLVLPDTIVQRNGVARNVVKVLENKAGKPRRVRAAYNGTKLKDEVREEQYLNFSSDHLAKKIFCAALATRSKMMGARMETLDLEAFYLHERNKLPRTDYNPISSPVEVMSHIIDCIPDSAAEAEYVSVQNTTKRGVYCRNIMEGIGYPQNTTEHECDNKCAFGIANNTVHDRKTKHIDRRYHWVKNEEKKGILRLYGRKG